MPIGFSIVYLRQMSEKYLLKMQKVNHSDVSHSDGLIYSKTPIRSLFINMTSFDSKGHFKNLMSHVNIVNLSVNKTDVIALS